MKLKASLLYMILENPQITNRYSRSYENLKNVIDLELKESPSMKEDIVYKKFKKLQNQYNSFYHEIPLKIVEKYYFKYREKLNHYVFIEYKKKDFNIKIIDLYFLLENFFLEVFECACMLANQYNLEIKINHSSSDVQTI
jgi:hypothetical protein